MKGVEGGGVGGSNMGGGNVLMKLSEHPLRQLKMAC